MMKCKPLLLAVALALSGCAATEGTKPLSVDNSPAFQLPAYETLTLDNGLTLYLMQQKEVPLITVNAVVRAGAVNDQLPGISAMTAESLLLGAGGKSKRAIEDKVDFLGASLNVKAGKEGSYVSSKFMAKDTEQMLPLFADVLRRPDFDAAEFAKLKQREIGGLIQAKDSPRAVVGNYFAELVYGDHPYGNASGGNSDSIAALELSQVKGFYREFYQPGNTAIAVVGDFDVAEMKSKLSAAFADWQNHAKPQTVELKQALPAPTKARVLLVDKPDATETTFVIGGVGVTNNNPDAVGLTVVNTILGGRFTSWLNDELRVNAGLTYGARSGFVSFSESGLFQMSTFTKTETTEAAIDLALKTYGRLWQQGIDQATLDSAKAYVKGQFPPDFETSGQLAGLLTDMYLNGFDNSYINDFEKKVDSLTLAESQRLVNTYFPKDGLQFVLIGNAAKIAPLAAKYGEVTQISIKDVGFGG
ncbi:insulinase family protein [Shewanella sp. JM162201]|uniref:Insulinase family protein n=1 Tax=Shewanella jiangmenensis TaxID=2837387 RepID=A0ABS5V454_9GAMM|nr:pitrilysin family protein [Shewanella jiangmenensis]MBT1445242.1 insulinase family protein [Shewanella jiangmenensis]